jgi:hypothetical protein
VLFTLTGFPPSLEPTDSLYVAVGLIVGAASRRARPGDRRSASAGVRGSAEGARRRRGFIRLGGAVSCGRHHARGADTSRAFGGTAPPRPIRIRPEDTARRAAAPVDRGRRNAADRRLPRHAALLASEWELLHAALRMPGVTRRGDVPIYVNTDREHAPGARGRRPARGFPIAPPIEPLADELPAGRLPLRAEVGRLPRHRLPRRRRRVHPEPRPAAARPLLPRAARRAARAAARAAAWSTARSSSPTPGPRLRRAAAAPPPGRVARREAGAEIPASFVAFDLLAVDGADLRGAPAGERRSARAAAGRSQPPGPPHADDARPRRRRDWLRSSRARASTA